MGLTKQPEHRVCIAENVAIDKATEDFRRLLNEQLQRTKGMNEDNKFREHRVDFTKLNKVIIGVIPGDGIGPVIADETVKVLNEVLKDELNEGKVEIRPIEGLTIENRIAVGESVPHDVLEKIKECHVLLKGPTETPKGGTDGGNMRSANVTLRAELDLFANVRPVQVPEKNIDWIFFRENTEGEYVLGSRGIDIPDLFSVDFKVISKAGTERIARTAMEYARANGKKKVAVVTKANIIKKCDGNFSKICHEIAEEFPELEVEDYYVDIMAAKMIDPSVQSNFQVFILPNLYGDILTDEAAQIQGGVGTAGSANIGSKYAMFEAIHGSAPRMIESGRGQYANPSSLIKAASMMLSHIGKSDAASKIEAVLDKSDSKWKSGVTAKEFGDWFCEMLSGE
ncbi:MAG: isocitrate/isopropylmalate family dehydrogenase [Clostridiales bacterium]|nr:isocitrate/isopropylmalate family dehydrogenase [Clostridiales bacterium]